MSLSEFLSKNRNRLDFEVKVKLVELLEHFIRKCPENGVNARNMIAVEVKRLAVQNDPVLQMLIYQLFLENPRNFVLIQVREICTEIEEILCNDQLFQSQKELLKFLKAFGSRKAKKHECKIREIQDDETLIDVDLREIPVKDFTSKFEEI